MSSAQDLFYIVRRRSKSPLISCSQIFTNHNKSHHIMKSTPVSQRNTLPTVRALNGRKVDELDMTISVASRNPAWYGTNDAELEKRRMWTSSARTQVGNIKKAVAGNNLNGTYASNLKGMRQELMRLPNSQTQDGGHQYIAQDCDDFVSSESDRQLLLIKQQDEELDELSASVIRIGGVGLTIHEELVAQEKIIDELGSEMDSTSTRLDFVQKKVVMVMKKASAKGQIMMILVLGCFVYCPVCFGFLDLYQQVRSQIAICCKNIYS